MTVHEPTAWMRFRVATIVAKVNGCGYTPARTRMSVITPLGSSGTPGSRQDRECDRCGTFVPRGEPLHLFKLEPKPRLFIVGGLCTSCAAREGMTERREATR